MNVALVGSSGYIAEYLNDMFKKASNVESILKIDCNNEADIYLNLLSANEFEYSVLDDIDFIVFTAAISGPDKCANEFEWCWKINVEGTIYFIREAIKRKCRVLFFSSDAVFGDSPDGIYIENSITRASTPYGKMKKAVEDEFVSCALFKAIRLSYVASAKDKFIKYCLNCARNNETAEIFHPFYRNVVVISDVVKVVSFFLNEWENYEYSFLNVAGCELVSRIRIADELNRKINNQLEYIVTKPNINFFKNRPQITQMESLYLYNRNILQMGYFSEKIKKELEVIKL